MAKVKNNRERRNPLVWLLFAIVIPLMIVFVLLFFVLQIAGVNPGGWMKDTLSNTPAVSKLGISSEDKDANKKAERANKVIEDQKEEINDLTREIESLEDINAQLEMDIKKLENRTSSKTDSNTPDEKKDSKDDEVKDVASSFQKMDPDKAANIIENMQQDMAVAVLNELSGKVRGNILGEMNPELAANIMGEMMP